MKSLKSSVRNNAHAMSPRPNSAPIQIQNILHTTNIPLPWSPLGEDRRIVMGLTWLNADFPAHNVRKMQSRPNLVSFRLTTWTFNAFFA